MITYRLGLYQAEEDRARELVEAIKRHPGSCDTVWMTTMGYYPLIEKHKKYAADWVRSAEIFKEAGLKVSLQISNTIGHCDWQSLLPEKRDEFALGMLPRDGEDPYMVGPDGKKNISCFCWRSKQFKKYIADLLKTYCSVLKPYRVWFDDDLRAHNHRPNQFGCYCDRCIALFNEENGSSYTREELVEKMNYSDPVLRKRYIDFIRRGIYEFTYGAAKACLDVAPSTLFGHEYEHEHNYLGPNDEHILAALHDASGNTVETRPGGGYYNDKAPWGQYVKTLTLSAANSLLPSYVTACVAEIENLPGVAFGKSIGGIINEGTLDLAFGCTGLTFTDVQSCHEPMSYYERIFKRFAEIRPYWERLSTTSKSCYRGGVSIYWGEAPHLKPQKRSDPIVSWDKVLKEFDVNLTRVGVPLTYDFRGSAAYLIHHDTVDGLTDSDIEFLLTKPVITDGESVQKIRERGYEDRFRFTPKMQDNNTTEYFTDLCGEGSYGQFFNENPYAASPMQRYVFDEIDEHSQILGMMRSGYHLGDNRELGAATIVTETAGGGKWAIFGYSLWSDIISSTKRRQILTALDLISTMPARLVSDEQAAVIPSVDALGRTISVTVSSVSQNGTDCSTLEIRSPRSDKITVMGTRHDFYDAFVTSVTSDSLIISLPPLDPYEIITVFLD